MAFPRILIAGLRGGSGKTIVSLGLIASLRKRGMVVAPFKKGPDFIDAGWLALAAGYPCHNLDAFMQPARKIRLSFFTYSLHSDIAVIEGNRGLYDGLDVEGSVSTAELAKLLKLPVILVVDCTKSTRTVGAMVLGCLQFDRGVDISGVILNRVAGSRHESILREVIASYCRIPVVGAIPKLGQNAFPERHMGLVPTPEHAWAKESIDQTIEVAEQYLDLEKIITVARRAPEPDYFPSYLYAADQAMATALLFKEETSLDGEMVLGKDFQPSMASETPSSKVGRLPRIGVIQDEAFQFYYPENIDALKAAGAEIVYLSALRDPGLGDIDGLYIGGGFPETHAEALAANASFRQDVLDSARQGLPVYAECGGLMYLGQSLVMGDDAYPMAGVFPVVFGFSKRPQGHGYTLFEVESPNPYFPVGSRIPGHEFHYSHVLQWNGAKEDLVFKMLRGNGIDGKCDGLSFKNTLAAYTHIHALGVPVWARSMVEAARARLNSVRSYRTA